MQEDNKISFQGTLIWLITSLFFVYEFMARVMTGSFQATIMHDLDISIVEFSLISSTFYQIVYGLMQIPVGFLTDKFGLKTILTTASLLTTGSIFMFSFVDSFWAAAISRILLGLGTAAGFICVLITVHDWMPRKKMATFIGLSQFIGTLGPMIAAGPLVSLSIDAEISWRSLFFFISIAGLGLTLLILLFVKNNPNPPQTYAFRILRKDLSFFVSLRKVFRQRQLWAIAIFSGLNYFAIEYLAENEGISFLKSCGYSYQFSSYMLTLAWLGYAIGNPLLGLLSDFIKRRNLVMRLGISLCLGSLLIIFYFPANHIILIASFFLLGIGSSSISIAYAVITEQTNDDYRAAALGFNNAFVFVVISSIAPIVGQSISHLQASQGHLTPTMGNYQIGFSAVIIAVAIGLFISLLGIRETFCKSQQTPSLLNY